MLKEMDESGLKTPIDIKEMGLRLFVVGVVVLTSYATAKLYSLFSGSKLEADSMRSVYIIQLLIMFLTTREYSRIPVIKISGIALLLGTSTTLVLLLFQ